MNITKQEVEKIAHLSRLNFNSEELEKIQTDLSNIFQWMEKLNELNTDDIEPQIFMTKEENIFREDIVIPTISHQQALENAPHKDSNYFRVPKTLE